MDDEAALLRAVLESPSEDAPRLVYADWCDEHGDPARAEFIRIQCRLAESLAGAEFREPEFWTGLPSVMPPRGQVCRHDPAARWLCTWPLRGEAEEAWCPVHWDIQRQGELLGFDLRDEPCPPRPRPEWAEGVAAAAPTLWRFDRGFVGSLRLPLDGFLRHGPGLPALPLLTDVRVEEWVPAADRGFLPTSWGWGDLSFYTGSAAGGTAEREGWRRLGLVLRRTVRGRRFGSPEHAHRAVSRVLLWWLRREAGLSPLARPGGAALTALPNAPTVR